MRNLILKWLFGTDDIKGYYDLFVDCRKYNQRCVEEIEKHLSTLKEERENLDIIRKLIRVCENHGINADEEIKHIKL